MSGLGVGGDEEGWWLAYFQVKNIFWFLWTAREPPNFNQRSQMASLSPKYQSSFQWQVSTTEPDASSRHHNQWLENVNNTSDVWCRPSLGLLAGNRAWDMHHRARRVEKHTWHCGRIISVSENRLWAAADALDALVWFSSSLTYYFWDVIWPQDTWVRLRKDLNDLICFILIYYRFLPKVSLWS